jgi:branched-chain amino acid transport system permease protein
LAFVGAIVGTGILAALVERIALRPLVGRPVFVTIMVTIFVGMILRTLFMVIWGTEQYGMPTPWDDRMSKVEVLGAQVSLASVATVGVSLLGLGIFFLLIRYTRLGIAMRAAANDQETSLALGIPVGRIFGATWFIAGLYAALGGIFLGMSVLSPVQVGHGDVAFRAFPAVIVGGLESPLGAVVAGLMLGILEVLTESYLNDELGQFGQNFHAVAPYFVMILVLIVRPYGLFGAKTVRRI